METITRIGLRGGGRRDRGWLGSHLNTKTHCNGHVFVFKGKGERWGGNIGSRHENVSHIGTRFRVEEGVGLGVVENKPDTKTRPI